MAEAKHQIEDKDDWIFNSMDRYEHLYMFDLEFPVDAFEVINDTSLCLAGLQTYSKNCEIVQLSIPPKLLPKNMEDGLCKDRDFNIISGGYSTHRITQIKAVHSNPRLLATVQTCKAGVSLFELGDENHAVTIPKGDLSLARLGSSSLVQVIATTGNKIALGNNFGKFIHEWKVDSPISSSSCIHHVIPDRISGITKIKFWDENSVIFSTNKGGVAIYDLRGMQIGVEIQSSKSEVLTPTGVPIQKVQSLAGGVCIKENTGLESMTQQIQESIKSLNTESSKENPIQGLKEILIQDDTKEIKPTMSTEQIERQELLNIASKNVPNKLPEKTYVPDLKSTPILWSFDSLPSIQKVGIVDSCGGYETFDIRKVTGESNPLTNRVILPDCTAEELLGQKFNIEYEPYIGFGSEVKFIVTGMKEDNVLVYSDRVVGGLMEISPVFTHDGHASTVTHALWHPLTRNLLFSTSTNSTLHAWQYI